MSKSILREKNGAKKVGTMKKIVKKPKQIELGEINQVMMLCNVIDSLEQKCLQHGLQQQLALLRQHFQPSYSKKL